MALSSRERFHKADYILRTGSFLLQSLFHYRWKAATGDYWVDHKKCLSVFLRKYARRSELCIAKIDKDKLIQEGPVHRWDARILLHFLPLIRIDENSKEQQKWDKQDKAIQSFVSLYRQILENREGIQMLTVNGYDEVVKVFRTVFLTMPSVITADNIEKLINEAGSTCCEEAWNNTQKEMSLGDIQLAAQLYETAADFYQSALSTPSLLPVHQCILREKIVAAGLKLEAEIRYNPHAYLHSVDVLELIQMEIEEVLRWDQYSWNMHFAMGKVFQLTYNFPKANVHFKKTLALYPKGQNAMDVTVLECISLTPVFDNEKVITKLRVVRERFDCVHSPEMKISVEWAGAMKRYKEKELLIKAWEGSVTAQKIVKTLLHNYDFIRAWDAGPPFPNEEREMEVIDALYNACMVECHVIRMRKPLRASVASFIREMYLKYGSKMSEKDKKIRILLLIFGPNKREGDEIPPILEIAEVTLERYPEQAILYSLLANFYDREHKHDLALKIISKGLEKYPNYVKLRYDRAHLSRSMEGECPREHYEQLLKVLQYDHRRRPEVHYQLAMCYLDEIEVDEMQVAVNPAVLEKALEHFQMGLRLETIQLHCYLPYPSTTKNYLVNILVMRGIKDPYAAPKPQKQKQK